MTHHLVHGKTYGADLSLAGLASMASNAQVAGRLTAAGFVGVQVSGTGSKRQARGTWGGEDREVELPKQVLRVYEL